MPDVSVRGQQRVVLVHTRGPYAGLHQIMGQAEEFGADGPPPLTDVFEITPGTRMGQASLIRVTPRMFIFREINEHAQKSFHPEQR